MNNLNINNARLNALRESYERAYNDIYTFHITSDSISMSPYISGDHPIKHNVITGLTFDGALKRVKELHDTITTVNQAIKLIDKLIAYYNLEEEITVHTQDSIDYGALMNNLDMNPDYSIYNITPFGEVAVIYYEDRPTAILLDEASKDNIIESIADLNRVLERMA